MRSSATAHTMATYTERGSGNTFYDQETQNILRRGAGYPLVGSGVSSTSGQFAVRYSNSLENPDYFGWLLHLFKPEKFTKEFLDTIIDMPPGWQTKSVPNNSPLHGMPLGLFKYFLLQRMIDRGIPASNLNNYVISGMMDRIQNEVVQVPQPDTADPSVTYLRKRIIRTRHSYSFFQFPLRAVELLWPFGWEGTPRSHFENWPAYEGERNTGPRFRDRMFLFIYNYLEEMTKPEGGSDLTMFVFCPGVTIFKRYHSTFPAVGANERFNVRTIRSAGLRQVLIEPLLCTIEVKDNFHNLTGQNVFQIYYPSGQEKNCFEASIQWAMVRQMLQSGNYGEDVSYIESEVRKKWIFIMTSVASKSKKTLEQYYRDYLKAGYPTKEMKKIAHAVFEHTGYIVETWYKRRRAPPQNGSWENIIKLDLSTIATSSSSSSEIVVDQSKRITLYQCKDDGRVRDDSSAASNISDVENSLFENQADSGDLGIMLHCIAIYPSPLCFLPDRRPQIGAIRQSLITAINDKGLEYMLEMYRRQKYWEDITMDNILSLVNAQLQRYRNHETKTLIFAPSDSKKKRIEPPTSSSSTSGDSGGRKKSVTAQRCEKNDINPIYFVFAYDLETISNVSEIQESMVYEPFRRILPSNFEKNASEYEPHESQIPFSCQWVAVNVSDRGTYLCRKTHEKAKTGEPISISTYSPDPDSENQEFFLCSPRTEYASNSVASLGKCVEEMLVNIAEYTHSRGGEQAFCFAHNGAHFDAYIVLQFQRFEIRNILKTSRGVMTVSLRVPITMTGDLINYDYKVNDLETPKITLILRDTMLQVPGSLAKLCKGFNVPKEYCKLDFPIAKINHNNFNSPHLRKLIMEYGENDVRALGVIIVRINDLIGGSQWKPAKVTSLKPPVTQFVTCMGMIRESTRLHFKKHLPENHHPKAIDIPALRTWLQNATIGGRVNAYAKTYISPFTGQILKSYLEKDTEALRSIYSKMMTTKQCMQVLDFTSLYPFAMDSCPMPTGRIFCCGPLQCEEDINRVHCADCDNLMSLCVKHRLFESTCNNQDIRPFTIVIVKNLKMGEQQRSNSIRNMCPRKSFLSSTDKSVSLLYSLENNEEFSERSLGREKLHETQSFTNIDLYWMRRQGYSFEIVGGFGFRVTSVYNLFIGPAFRDRIQAKKDGNKLLSDFLKLNYNGSFGITTQQDITDCYFPVRVDDSIRDRDPRDPIVRKRIVEALSKQGSISNAGLSVTEELTGEAVYLPNKQALYQKRKKEHLAEYFADQSPMQIGAAVLAWSRHIANLVMFNNHELDQTYTDTDSICISEHAIQSSPQLQNMIVNSDDAPLGSLKNDHAENNGTEPRVFCSLIGAKKVKCHITLNKEGEVRIFNTFKGLNVSNHVENKTFEPGYAEKISTQTLFYLNVDATSVPPVIVQSWKRNLGFGVSISNHLQTLSPDTYLESCVGTSVFNLPHGFVEYFIPNGCGIKPQFPTFIDGENMTITQGQLRRDALETEIYNNQFSVDTFHKFIDLYYEETAVESTINDPLILEAFQAVTNEII